MTRKLALISLLFATRLLAQDQADLEAAKAKYLQALPTSGEAARTSYVRELIEMHYKLMDTWYDRQWTDKINTRFRAINDELKKVPAPADSDSAALSKLRIGRWRSPRHDYIYRRNGTWSMLPIEDADTTHGTWSIKGNQYLDGGVNGGAPWEYKILFLDARDFVFTDRDGEVFYEERILK